MRKHVSPRSDRQKGNGNRLSLPSAKTDVRPKTRGVRVDRCLITAEIPFEEQTPPECSGRNPCGLLAPSPHLRFRRAEQFIPWPIGKCGTTPDTLRNYLLYQRINFDLDIRYVRVKFVNINRFAAYSAEKKGRSPKQIFFDDRNRCLIIGNFFNYNPGIHHTILSSLTLV